MYFQNIVNLYYIEIMLRYKIMYIIRLFFTIIETIIVKKSNNLLIIKSIYYTKLIFKFN